MGHNGQDLLEYIYNGQDLLECVYDGQDLSECVYIMDRVYSNGTMNRTRWLGITDEITGINIVDRIDWMDS